MRSIPQAAVLVLAICLLSPSAQARPEKIKAGLSYYSDEVQPHGQTQDLVGEKNYEEVYQLYTYYEVIYDDSERVSLFKEYKRGELIRTESYEYNAAGKLEKKEIRRPGEPTDTISFPG
jgi:hypothetical protein